MAGNKGVSTRWVNENHEIPIIVPIAEPIITWFHVWYCKYVLLRHTSIAKHQHEARTSRRPTLSNGNALLFMWCNLASNEIKNCVSGLSSLTQSRWQWQYLRNTKSVTYVEKNQMNCEWLDGIPYSSPMCIRSTGRGSCIQCFKNLLHISLTSVPKKNVI